MDVSAKELKKLKKVLSVKKTATEAKQNQTRKIQTLVREKIEEVKGKLDQARQNEADAQAGFFGAGTDGKITDKDLSQYVIDSKKAAEAIRKEEKNILLLEKKYLELEEIIKSYQVEILKIDKKAEHLFS